MTPDNLDAKIIEIENNLIRYTKSLDELREYINKFELLDIFQKSINQELDIENQTSFKNQLNFTGFLTISILDLLSISKKILIAKHQWELIHELKLGYMVIYETIRTYHKHREINTLVKKSNDTAILYTEISFELKEFKSRYDYPVTFTNIRNATIAHIDTDFKTYYDTVNKINGNKFYEAILSFLKILFKMQELSRYLSNTLLIKNDGEVIDIEELEKILESRNRT